MVRQTAGASLGLFLFKSTRITRPKALATSKSHRGRTPRAQKLDKCIRREIGEPRHCALSARADTGLLYVLERRCTPHVKSTKKSTKTKKKMHTLWQSLSFLFYFFYIMGGTAFFHQHDKRIEVVAKRMEVQRHEPRHAHPLLMNLKRKTLLLTRGVKKKKPVYSSLPLELCTMEPTAVNVCHPHV